MTRAARDPRWKAGFAAALFFGLGVVFGVAVDRVLTGRAPAAASALPLTVDAMAEALDLDTVAERKVRVLLDSLEPDIAQAATLGADSLRAAARQARRRLEEVLPPDRRARFRSWMDEHHSRMMESMGRRGSGMMMDREMHHRETGDSGMMGRGMMGDTVRRRR